jgi:uncharacterized membrane protein YhhN
MLEQLVFGVGDLLMQIPPLYFVLLFIIFLIASIVVSGIFRFHLNKYTFQDSTIRMTKLIYPSGLGILSGIAFILLGLILSQS